MTIGRYSDIALHDPHGKDRSGAVFLLRRKPIQDAAIRIAGWTVEVRRASNVVVAHGPERRSYEDAFESALSAANNGLDYMSFRGQCDVAIHKAYDDCIVWWADSGSVTMRARMVHTATTHSSASLIITDSTGAEVAQAPEPTPHQHDAFRYVRMSRTSEYLYDSHRNMFMALESILSEIHPGIPGERAWFRSALQAADKIESIASLAPPNVQNPLNWICNNLYSNERSGLMHSKSTGSYHLPQDHRKRARIESSLRRLSTYTIKLLERKLGVKHLSSGFFQPGWEMMVRSLLSNTLIAATDDRTPFSAESDVDDFAPNGGGVAYFKMGSLVSDDEPFLVTVTAACKKQDLDRLDGLYKFGVVSKDCKSMILGEFFEGLHLGADVDRFEIMLGMRNINSTGPRSHFSA